MNVKFLTHLKKSMVYLPLLITLLSWSSAILAECNFVVKAAIQIKRNNNAFLGGPSGEFTDIANHTQGGCFRNYQNGSIYASNTTGAQMIYGTIKNRWFSLGGGAKGLLGLPTTDESATPDGHGRYNHFEKGSIYWHPCIGAFEIYGLIRDKWSSLGWEKSFLGYPKSGEMATSDGKGRYTEFQGGRIIYHPLHGTHVVSGAILRQWADLGFEKSSFGYPVEEMKCTNASFLSAALPCSQKFKMGTITENWNTVDMRGEIARRGIAIRDQSTRPTCSVFASTFLLEYAYTGFCGQHYQNLSEEYLNHVANLATGGSDDGDFFSSVIAGYNQYGVVTETQLPYMASYDFNTFNLPSNVVTLGAYHIRPFAKMKATWIRSIAPTAGLSDEEFNKILSYVRTGVPVAIGRSHSLVIVGYEKGTQFPGGGRFIIRNSYGVNLAGTINGYQYEDFESVKNTVYDVYVFTR